MEAMLAGVLVFAVFVGPLIARIVLDRRLDRANIVAADVRAAVRQPAGRRFDGVRAGASRPVCGRRVASCSSRRADIRT